MYVYIIINVSAINIVNEQELLLHIDSDGNYMIATWVAMFGQMDLYRTCQQARCVHNLRVPADF